LGDAFPGDVVGVLLADSLEKTFLAASFLSDELKAEIIELQKTDNVIYGQMRYTFRNVIVDGVKYGQFYCYVDGLSVYLNGNVFLVVSFIPSREPAARGPDFEWVSNWYKNFAVLIDP
jgi:hypothetical protein